MYYCLNLLCPISIFMVLYLESRIVLNPDLNQDCPSSPLSTRKVVLPDPKGDFKETMRFFGEEFGFTGLF